MSDSDNIEKLKKKTKAQTGNKVEVEKVSRLLKISYKKRKIREDLSDKLDSLATSLDPRASAEDYIRRRQRLQEEIDTTAADPAYGGIEAVTKALEAAREAIKTADEAIKKAQTGGTRPAYGDQRDVLGKASKKLHEALNKADKHFDKVEEDKPDAASKLDAIERALDNPQLPASAEQIKQWRDRYDKIARSFYQDKPAKDAPTLAEQLHAEMKRTVDQNRNQIAEIKKTAAELTNRAVAAGLPITQLAPIQNLITQARGEAELLAFDAARKLLGDADKLLPPGQVGAPPKMDEVERERLALKARMQATLDVKPGGQPPQGVAPVFSEPGRKRVVDLMHKLDELAPLCQQTTQDVALEAIRRVRACQDEFGKVCSADGGVKAFADKKEKTAKEIGAIIERVRKGLEEAPITGAAIQIEARLVDLETSFKTTWPTLMTQDEVDSSGLVVKALDLSETFTAWEDGLGSEFGLQTWQGAFQGACDRLHQVTEQAKQKYVGLLSQFGLLTTMPALEGKGVTLAAKPEGEKEVRKITVQIVQTVLKVEEALKGATPESLENVLKEGTELAEALKKRLTTQVETLEKLQPGKASQKAKNFVKFFRESAFGDDAERELRIKYGKGLSETLEGLEAMLRCKDPTAANGALEEIKAFQAKVADFEKMGTKVNKDSGAPTNFGDLLERMKKIKSEIEQQTSSNLKSRPDVLKDWNEKLDALTDQLGETEPARLLTEVQALEKEIVEKTIAVKKEINVSVEQLEAIMKLLIRLKDAGKKNSPLVKQFGPLLADLNRRGDAMKEAVSSWQVADAGFDDWKKDVEALLNTTRSQDETDGLKKKSDAAAETDKKVVEARKQLLALRDADLKLAKEKFEKVGDKDRREVLLKLVSDLSKETDRAIDSLAENRDAGAAETLVASVKREIAEAQNGAGDELTARNDFETLDKSWRGAVAAIRDAVGALETKITEAAKDMPGDDVANAVKSLGNSLVKPSLALFTAGAFASSLKGLRSQDATVRAKNREAALAEVRRIRRVLESDARIRLLALDNPFGVAIPFSELSSRLFDIEVNVTRARGS